MTSRPERLRRSELSTPATSLKMIQKGVSSGADFVFLDLEDSIAPAMKAEARANAALGLKEMDWGRKTRAVRVNGPRTPWCFEDVIDLVGIAGNHLDVLVVPKVKTAADVQFFDLLLLQLETAHGLTPGKIGLELLIEEVEAVQNIDQIAASSTRLEALILGVGDLAASQGMRSADIGRSKSYPGDVWHYARTRMIIAARANGLEAIDGPFADYRDLVGYREESEWAAALGITGKWAIHPAQVDVANMVFSTSPEEVSKARKVVDAVRLAELNGAGAVAIDGVMADAASLRIYQTVLKRAALEGFRYSNDAGVLAQ